MCKGRRNVRWGQLLITRRQIKYWSAKNWSNVTSPAARPRFSFPVATYLEANCCDSQMAMFDCLIWEAASPVSDPHMAKARYIVKNANPTHKVVNCNSSTCPLLNIKQDNIGWIFQIKSAPKTRNARSGFQFPAEKQTDVTKYRFAHSSFLRRRQTKKIVYKQQTVSHVCTWCTGPGRHPHYLPSSVTPQKHRFFFYNNNNGCTW